MRRSKQSVVPPAPAPSAAARREPAEARIRDLAPTFQDEDEMTMLLPSSLRGGAVSGAPMPEAQASRPLLALHAPEGDDEEATRMFDSGRLSARPSARPEHGGHPYAEPTMLAAGQHKKNTLARNPSEVEDDIQARARLAFETGENPALRPRGPHAGHAGQAAAGGPGHALPPPLMQHGSTPAPAYADPNAAMIAASRRPLRSATSTASAFQRTEAEIPPAFAPSARPVPKTHVGPLPGAPSSLPAASWTASGEQVALRSPTRRGAASWFMALGAAAVVVVVGSAVLLRNPSTALAASALADPQLPTPVAPTAELPTAPVSPPAAPSAAVAAAPPAPPPPQYVPGSVPAGMPEPAAAVMPDSPEPSEPTKPTVATAAADEPAAKHGKRAERASHTPASHAPAAPKAAPPPAKPTPISPPKADPPPKPKKEPVAAADPPPKKGKKGEQTDEERKASEEAARLARKQLDDQL